MKIALLGYGRMGHAIEEISEEHGHRIVYKTSTPLDIKKLKTADVAIDFSVPESAFDNITTCLREKIPIVSGTTGWLDRFDEVCEICEKEEGAFLYASNFSIGVNLFFRVNEFLADLMKNQQGYQLSLKEIHHTGKKDKPSGTAISLAEGIIRHSDKKSWELVERNKPEKPEEGVIPIEAERTEGVKGTHVVRYTSTEDTLEISHKAFSRKGFAHGALLAAEFIKEKKGVFSMREVLQNLI